MELHAQKMELLKALREHGHTIAKTLQHFDVGGQVMGVPASPTFAAPNTALGGSGTNTVNSAANPNTGIAGTITGGLGLTNNFQAGAANIQPGTNQAQLQSAYTGAQSGLTQQQGFANATVPGGSGALTSQQALLTALQNESNGQGPNPAQAALNQNTGANIASQAALMAGQRGASANAGLEARQAAQTGAVTQQNAVGQAATLQAQQQLAAQQELQTQQAQMVGQEATAIQGVNSTQQNEQNILQGANTAANNATVSMQNGINSANATTAASNQGFLGSVLGGVASGVGAGLAVGALAKGGVIPKKFAAGGVTGAGPALQMPSSSGGPQSMAGQWLNSTTPTTPGPESVPVASPSSSSPNSSIGTAVAGYLANNPSTDNGAPDPFNSEGAPAVGSLAGQAPMPGQSIPSGDFAKGGSVRNFKPGGKVPGQPKVNKDSYKNDTVPAMVSPGEIVLPLHVTKSSDPVSAAAQFVAAIMKKKAMSARAA